MNSTRSVSNTFGMKHGWLKTDTRRGHRHVSNRPGTLQTAPAHCTSTVSNCTAMQTSTPQTACTCTRQTAHANADCTGTRDKPNAQPLRTHLTDNTGKLWTAQAHCTNNSHTANCTGTLHISKLRTAQALQTRTPQDRNTNAAASDTGTLQEVAGTMPNAKPRHASKNKTGTLQEQAAAERMQTHCRTSSEGAAGSQHECCSK